jgi:hypothetical protein
MQEGSKEPPMLQKQLITEITFSLGKKTPLSVYSGDPEDRFDMLSPMVSAKSTLVEQLDPANEDHAKKIADAYQELRDVCLTQLTDFHRAMFDFYKQKKGKR